MLFNQQLDITISQATYADIPHVANIRYNALDLREKHKIRHNDLQKDILKDISQNYRKNMYDIFIKATDTDEQIVGYLTAKKLKYSAASIILEFYTLPMPEYKPGSKLMRHYLNDMCSQNIEEILVSSSTYALEIYKHYGFEQYEGHDMRLLLQQHPEYNLNY